MHAERDDGPSPPLKTQRARRERAPNACSTYAEPDLKGCAGPVQCGDLEHLIAQSIRQALEALAAGRSDDAREAWGRARQLISGRSHERVADMERRLGLGTP